MSSGELRAAVEAGAWARVVELVPLFRAEVESALEGLPAGSPEAVWLVEEARALLAWARITALCHQAHLAAQLSELVCANRYFAPRCPGGTWEMLG